MNNAYSQ